MSNKKNYFLILSPHNQKIPSHTLFFSPALSYSIPLYFLYFLIFLILHLIFFYFLLNFFLFLFSSLFYFFL